MLAYAQKKGAKCVISTAASSALGKQLVKFFNSNGIEVINIVRKDDYVNDLKQNHNAKYALN